MDGLELYDIINKGVPNYVKVELDANVMIRECASDRPTLITEIQRIKSEYEKRIIGIMGFDKYRSAFFKDFRILTSYKNALSTLHISPVSYVERLKKILGVTNPSTNLSDYGLKMDLYARYDLLKGINDPVSLSKEFPEIYKDYVNARMYYEQLKELNANPAYSGRMNHQWQMYNAFGFDTRFKNFMARQLQMYHNFIARMDRVERECDNSPLDLSQFSGLDKEKFGFYVAYRYLETAQAAQQVQDFKTVQNCVYYLMTYFRESTNYDISITGPRGKKLTYRRLLSEFKRILGSSKDLKPIDEDRTRFKDYHIKHVINHLNKYYGNMVNWYIVPNGKKLPLQVEQEMILGKQRNALSPEEKQKQITKRMALYNQKVEFYENSGYVLKIFGWNEFNGYICYIYPNGKIVMDKLFEDYIKCTPAREEAIYAIDAVDFDSMSKKTKQQLINSPKARRIYHAGDWEGRTKSIIEAPSTPEGEEAVRKLELRFKNNS